MERLELAIQGYDKKDCSVMITFLKRNQINDTLYNACIENALNSELYAFSWYLDIVAKHWCVLVLNDYEAVMPIPFRKKIGITYTYQPLWTLQLGVFGNGNVDDFIKQLTTHFSYVELRLHPLNQLKKSNFFIKNSKQVLDVFPKFTTDSFRKDRKKDIRKAEEHQLEFKEAFSAVAIISLFKNNVGKRTPNILQKDYEVLYQLTQVLIDKKLASIYHVCEEDKLVAAACVLFYKQKATILFSSTDFENRDHGANTFLIAKIIETCANQIKEFDFGGSSIPSIANYFKSFGAKTITYPFLKINNLPFPLKLMKR